jgi:hypothetical protein
VSTISPRSVPSSGWRSSSSTARSLGDRDLSVPDSPVLPLAEPAMPSSGSAEAGSSG